ncbi:MAG: hypothetical protein KJN76_07470 [Eudoraea sp.]|nr:hypothetical protein [Eudoraea sp.]
MKNLLMSIVFFLGINLIPAATFAQEEQEIDVEESAEVFLEQYTDEFQENFFEALKQKGIENYDKAINLLLECKRMDIESTAVDHELAKVYLADKQYFLAQEYGLEAVNAAPYNYWYLNTLESILRKQGSTMASVKTKIPYDDKLLKENLALIHFRNRNYESALKVLKDLRKSEFTEQLAGKINDSISKKTAISAKNQEDPPAPIKTGNPIKEYSDKIADLISRNNFPALLEISTEALESFPSQPFFYYAQGLALNKSSKTLQAVEALETALDYLLDDPELADKIYRELAASHTLLGNTSKANMYLSKIKSGS